jgi:hypothetical protein
MRAFIRSIRSAVWTLVRAVKNFVRAFVSKELCARTASGRLGQLFSPLTFIVLSLTL